MDRHRNLVLEFIVLISDVIYFGTGYEIFGEKLLSLCSG